MTRVALTIAGSDPSGGAGLQADLKTFHQHGVYGTAVVTLLTVQNTLRVGRVEVTASDFVLDQLDAVLDDVPPHAIKTGALGSAAIVRSVAKRLARFGAPVVVDPVMVSTHGTPLADQDVGRAIITDLLQHAVLVTPNVHEAAVLSGRAVHDLASAGDAARAIVDLGARAVLVKGGHLPGRAVDLLFADGKLEEIDAARVDSKHTHGTGCAYSASITSWLARGVPLAVAVRRAKVWLTAAIETPSGVGAGIGPVGYFTPLPPEER